MVPLSFKKLSERQNDRDLPPAGLLPKWLQGLELKRAGPRAAPPRQVQKTPGPSHPHCFPRPEVEQPASKWDAGDSPLISTLERLKAGSPSTLPPVDGWTVARGLAMLQGAPGRPAAASPGRDLGLLQAPPVQTRGGRVDGWTAARGLAMLRGAPGRPAAAFPRRDPVLMRESPGPNPFPASRLPDSAVITQSAGGALVAWFVIGC